MRLSSTLLTLTLSFLHLTSALHTHSLRRKHTHSPDSITARQHHAPRSLIDICAYLNLNLADELSDDILQLLQLGTFLHIDTCICLSALPLYLEVTTDVTLRTMINILGISEVSNVLESLVISCPEKQQCMYPALSKPTCSSGNVCGYDCKYPYVRRDGRCVCELPNMECNGQCGSFQGCPSAIPRSLNGKSGRMIAREQSQAQASCKPGEQVCGVHGNGYECLDTNSDPESCGGCTIPSPFESSQPRGTDCTKIANVEKAVCQSGRCAVQRCSSGWNISPSGDHCMKADYQENTTASALRMKYADAYKPRSPSMSPAPMNQSTQTLGARDTASDVRITDKLQLTEKECNLSGINDLGCVTTASDVGYGTPGALARAGNIGVRADMVSDDIPNDKISSPKIASATNDGTGTTSETLGDDRNSHQQPR